MSKLYFLHFEAVIKDAPCDFFSSQEIKLGEFESDELAIEAAEKKWLEIQSHERLKGKSPILKSQVDHTFS